MFIKDGSTWKYTSPSVKVGGSWVPVAEAWVKDNGVWKKTFPLTPSPPTITSIVAGNAQLTVNFTAPTESGATAIDNYDFSTDNGVTWTTRSPASTASPIVITGLVNGTTYNVRVRARNSIGPGESSNTVAATPITTPSAPTITSIAGGNGILSVSFTAGFNGGSAITNYQFSINNGSTWTTRSPVSTASPLVIGGLSNGTTYTVRIRAINVVGNGDQSNAVNGTPFTIPSAPTLNDVAPNNGFLTVSFTAGSNGGSAITNYQYFTLQSGWVSAGTTSSPFNITGLTNDVNYAVAIRAVNAAGAGLSSGSLIMAPSQYRTAGGNEIKTVGSWRYHIFTSSGTFRVDDTSLLRSLYFSSLINGTVQWLIVGGGGAGGEGVGGGGGGGAVNSNMSSSIFPTSIASTNHSVTVGSGGASLSQSGGFSLLFGNLLNGGGGGGTVDVNGNPIFAPKTGGSGGGATYAAPAFQTPGGASGPATNVGGLSGVFLPHAGAGGGGGAVGAGGNGSTVAGGNGGQGALLTGYDSNLTGTNFSSFTSRTHVSSGGGGGTFQGGTAGSGGTGAGNGGSFANGTNASSFGCGGGGGADLRSAGTGFSGLVVIRYWA
jgi:hypothetical protein